MSFTIEIYLFPWLFIVNLDGVIKEVKIGLGRMEKRFSEEWRECRLLGPLNANDMRAMIGLFVEESE